MESTWHFCYNNVKHRVLMEVIDQHSVSFLFPFAFAVVIGNYRSSAFSGLDVFGGNLWIPNISSNISLSRLTRLRAARAC